VIKALNVRGVYQKDIAEQSGGHPETLSRALKREAVQPHLIEIGVELGFQFLAHRLWQGRTAAAWGKAVAGLG
jgi:hypothetical protein